jgi:hypothetical protein
MRPKAPALLLAAALGLSCARAATDGTPLDPGSPESYPELRRGGDGYWQVDFGQLASFDLVPPKAYVPAYRSRSRVDQFIAPEPQPIDISETDDIAGRIPKMVKALDGHRARVAGFMLPTRLENGLVTDFLLIRSQLTCCYGIPPAPNEWVIVAVHGKGVPQQMDVPIYVYGLLHVGAIFEDHEYAGIYRIDCEKIATQ